MFSDEYTQTMEPSETAPFEAGVGADVGGDFHVDGTPMRLVAVIVVGLVILVVWNQGGFRWHVTV
jgi:hypothetical protein